MPQGLIVLPQLGVDINDLGVYLTLNSLILEELLVNLQGSVVLGVLKIELGESKV